MENLEGTEPTAGAEQEQEQLVVTEEIRRYIYETARWTKFLSIVGLVCSVFIALMALSATAIIQGLSLVTPANPLVELGTSFLTVYFLCISLMVFYPSFLLLKYSNAANAAVLYADQANFTVAMEKMKSVFKFWGVIAIIVLALNALSFIAAIIAKLGVG